MNIASLATSRPILNPYLDAFLAAPAPEELHDARGWAALAGIRRRDRLTAEYAWAIPTEPVVRAIAALSPICDLGCGTGYWANLLAQAGAEVIAVDAIPPRGDDNHWHCTNKGATIRHWFPIVAASAAEFDVPIGTSLLLCWPPYNSPMADVALDRYRQGRAAHRRYRGDHVIYIGEGGGGCTGDDAFHERLAAEWSLVAEHEIPQWFGIHDSVRIYRARG